MSVATFVLPAEQRGRLTQRLGDGPAADDHQLGDRAEHRDDASSVTAASLAPRPKSRATSSPAPATRLGGEQRRADHLVAVEPGHQADRLAASRADSHSSGGSSVAGTSRQRASPPHDRPATSASTSLTCTSTSRPVVSATAGQVGELGVEGTADERADAAAAGRDGQGVGAISAR